MIGQPTPDLEERVQRTVQQVREAVGTVRPRVAMILGSGLSAGAFSLEKPRSVPLSRLDSLPQPSVAGHGGEWTFGQLAGVDVVVAGGRVHGYEGVELSIATLGVRVMARLGCEFLFVTNAAGGIREDLPAGSLMRLTDHLNLLGSSPLVGRHHDDWGARFVDMSQVYDESLARMADTAAANCGIALAHGVYGAMLGPQYETPAEIRFLKIIGADAVGMSTVPEAIVARQSGMRVLGISLISNRAAGLTAGHVLSHDEVLEAGKTGGGKLATILSAVLERLPA